MSKKAYIIITAAMVLIFAGCIWYALFYPMTGGGVYTTAARVTEEELFTGNDSPGSRLAELPAGYILNINTATVDELKMLPGIGEALAGAIVEYREANGRFESIEDIIYVSGIGEAKLEAIRQYITVEQEAAE